VFSPPARTEVSDIVSRLVARGVKVKARGGGSVPGGPVYAILEERRDRNEHLTPMTVAHIRNNYGSSRPSS